mmetsp:Transcript_35/g.98  ORF Transcript_35/g.98 Transcript_35/m.98 type:complete len:350 (-) Transcript_35:158-1207(-)
MVKRFDVHHFSGNNEFVCGKRFIVGPDYKKTLITDALILIPAILYIAVPEVFLVRYHPALGIVLLVLTKLLLIVSMVSMFKACATDPGIIPRREEAPHDLYDPYDPVPNRIRTKQILINNVPLKIKYCETCLIWRPPRSSHCNVCNNCVEGFDHHCPYLGNCVGRRNYRDYYVFVVSTLLLSILSMGGCIAYLVLKVARVARDEDLPSGEALARALTSSGALAAIFVCFFCLFGIAFCGTLAVFHTHLLFTNQTTKESCTKAWGLAGSPFGERGCASCRSKLCEKRPPSKLKQDCDIEPDDFCSLYPEVQRSAKRVLTEEELIERDRRDVEANGKTPDAAKNYLNGAYR